MNILKKWLALVMLLIPLEALQLIAQEIFIHPFSILEKMGTTASVQNDAVGSFINPALGATMPSLSNQLDLWAFADTKELTDITQWGYFYADPGLLAGANVLSLADHSTQIDFHFGISGGNRSIAFGFSNVSLFNENHSMYDYFHAFQVGFLLRPIPQTSLGITITQNYTSPNWNLLIDGGLRPFGTNRLTVFGAWSAQNSYTDQDAQKWLAGLSFVPVRGVEVYGKYLSSGSVALGLNLRYGNLGLGSSLASSQEDFSGSLQTGVGISFVKNKAGFAMTSSTTPKYYVELALENLSASSEIFNRYSSLFDVLSTIASAKNDPTVGGLILNTSSLYASRSDLWELRKALEDFKTSGKKIIAFIERPSFDVYALVTVADRIVMDNQGILNFDGYVVRRGYFKHTLEKLGVGFRELRYLIYKSAAESYKPG
ncbi:hypothetical protein [Gracilinema caldarium]|uniref:hypothetical protein n=1 Tax=Gracilinema caldarium TaxID=215591 RepID=UPI0003112629|nr:hypothetical protein [Gracilinema caldarium]